MGGTASTRNITIENETADNNVIRISDSVVHRIRDELKSQTTSSVEREPPPAPTPQPPHRYEEADASLQDSPPDGSAFSRDSVMTVMRLRREKEEAVAAVENEWRRRLLDGEMQGDLQAARQDEALRHSVAQTRLLFTHAAVQPVCQDCQERVVRCYGDHRGASLLCADEVRRFATCVKQARLAQLSRCS